MKDKPARRFIAEARYVGNDKWRAFWAYPGTVPKTGAQDFADQEEAVRAAKLILADALIHRVRDTTKYVRYQPMAGEDLAADLREAGITLTAFARITGTDQDNVLRWIDGLRAIPHTVRVILALLLTYPDALEVAETVTEKGSVPRADFAEVGSGGSHLT